MASHITAAAEGGPRYDKSLTPRQRKASANGIWLCAAHGKQVDDDLWRFSANTLRGWKAIAEARARSEQGVPENPKPPRALPPKQISVRFDGDYDALHETIELLREDIGLERAWGSATDEKVHYLLYELMINAFEHGAAATVELKSQDFSIELTFEGDRFGITELLNTSGNGGGKTALDAIRKEEAGRLEVIHHWKEGVNSWKVVDFTEDDSDFFPCSGHWRSMRASEIFQTCSEVHIYLPSYFAMSDAKRFPKELEDCLLRKQLVVHGAPKWLAVREYLATQFPNVRFVP